MPKSRITENLDVPEPAAVKATIEKLDKERAVLRALLKVSEDVHGKVETLTETTDGTIDPTV